MSTWTNREIALVKRLYPLAPQDEIQEMIPRHSWPRIRRIAAEHNVRRLTHGRAKWLRIAHEYLGDAR